MYLDKNYFITDRSVRWILHIIFLVTKQRKTFLFRDNDIIILVPKQRINYPFV